MRYLILLLLLSCSKLAPQHVSFAWAQYKKLSTIDISTIYPYSVPYKYTFAIYWHNSEYPEHEAIIWPVTVPATLTHYQFRDSMQFVDIFWDSVKLVSYQPE